MIQSILKAIDLLEAFTIDSPKRSLAELAEVSGHPKTTLHTILATLESRGYVARSGRDYVLGNAVINLSQSAYVNIEIRDRAAPGLRELADAAQESVYLTVPDGTCLLYIYAIESPHRLEARSAIGDHAYYHSTSVGKAALAFMDAELCSAILAAAGLPRRTDNTITDRAQLEREIASTRERGYSTDRCENEADTYCLGAPIFSAGGTLVASCSISGNRPELLTSRLGELSELVMRTADAISKRLGYVPTRSRIPKGKTPPRPAARRSRP